MESLSSMFNSFYQGASHLIEEATISAGFTNATAQTTSNVIKDFFINLYYHPDEHIIAVAVMVIVVVAAFVGIFFLIKKIWDRNFSD